MAAPLTHSHPPRAAFSARVPLLYTLFTALALGSPALPASSPPSAWDAEDLSLTVRLLPEARAVEGRAIWTVSPISQLKGPLTLHQEALSVREVLVDGESAEWALGEGTLTVPLSPAPHRVEVRWDATPETGLHFRLPVDGYHTEVWSQGEPEDHRYWFPLWDQPGDRFTATLIVTAPADLNVVASGALVGVEALGDERRWTYRSEARLVSYLVSIAAGDYALWSDRAGRTPLEYLGDASIPEAELRTLLSPVADALPWMEARLGPFPYPRYRQVVVQGLPFSGMENSGNTFLDDRRLPANAPLRVEDREALVVHELAHQWFGDHLSIAGWEHLWLNEGLATWWARRWLGERWGEPIAALSREEDGLRALGVALPLVVGEDEPPLTSWVPRFYAKGSMVIHLLEVSLGREALERGLERYVADNADQIVTTQDLREALEASSGEDLSWVFDQWVSGEGAPRARSSWGWEDGTLTVQLERDEALPWTLPVEVEVGTWQEAERYRLRLDQHQQTLTLPLAAPPLWVAVDPQRGSLTGWDQRQDEAAWLAQLARSPSYDARLDAIRALETGAPTEAALRALRGVLLDRETPGPWRARAALALSRQRAAPLLLEAAEDRDPVVREGVWRALAMIPPSAPPLLFPAPAAEPEPEVLAAWLRAGAVHHPHQVLGTARRWARGEPPMPQLLAAAEVLGARGHGRDAPLLRGLLTRTAPVQVAALSALPRLHQREPLTPRSASLAAARALASAPDRKVRLAALRAVGSLDRDPRWLQAWAAGSEVRADRELALTLAQELLQPPPTGGAAPRRAGPRAPP
ncbi:MAG: hypothetical protein JXX28_13920 [Deltaproteobacteria bacterium]|nr:hypothetical protein [Deltaproteobacteria bacterium]